MAGPSKLNKVLSKQIIASTETFFFDCDGVLWNLSSIIPGAVEFVNKLKEIGKQVFFVTNNSSKSRETIVEKFNKNGFNVSPKEILPTSYLAAMYFKNILKIEKKVYVLGSTGMKVEFDKAGVQYVGIGPRPRKEESAELFANYDIEKDPEVGAVCVGFDEHFNLNKIAQAMQYLQDETVPFVATNLDSYFHMGGGVFGPGTGCIVNAVATAAQRQPLVLGKPNKLLFDIARTVCDINPETSLMIGDRLDTDVAFGLNCEFHTLLVLSGVTKESMLENAAHIPDFYANSIADLLPGFDDL